MAEEQKRSRFRMVVDFVKRLLGKKPTQPGDPYAYVMAPGPKGRSGAAVAEIEDDSYRSFAPRR